MTCSLDQLQGGQLFLAKREQNQRKFDQLKLLSFSVLRICKGRFTREVHELAVSVQYFWSFRHSRKDRYFVDRSRQFVDLPRIELEFKTNPMETVFNA